MKDYIFNEPIPFVTEDSESSGDVVRKYLSRGMGFVFGNDQRNVLWFALGLGFPGIILTFVGLFMSGWGHPVLMTFDCLLVAFVAWVAWSMWRTYVKVNECVKKLN